MLRAFLVFQASVSLNTSQGWSFLSDQILFRPDYPALIQLPIPDSFNSLIRFQDNAEEEKLHFVLESSPLFRDRKIEKQNLHH